MFKAILMACSVALPMALATGAEAKLENTIDDTPAVREVVLTFTYPVDAERSKVRVFTSSGREISVDGLQTNVQGTDLIAPTGTLSPGTYKVFWQAVSRDGRAASGLSEITVPFQGVSGTSQAYGP